MRDFFDQVRRAAETKLYYLALFGALTIPDVCAGMDAPDGTTNGSRYAAWFDAWVARDYAIFGEPSFSGEDCYGLRCGALHQGRLEPHRGAYRRVIFLEPSDGLGLTMHNIVIDDVLTIDVPTFVRGMTEAADRWLVGAERTERFQANFAHFMQRYPEGFASLISGVPIIA